MCLPQVSIVIPTFNRPKELDACLTSLKAQTVQEIHIILLTHRAPLAQLRNQGLSQARAPVVAFIDDDVICSPTWLSSILRVLRESPQVMGVTGPTYIPASYRRNRDIYDHTRIRKIYDALFVGTECRPGHLTVAGTFVPDPDYRYVGPVQFLEACNMSFRTEAIRSIGGFDEAYSGIGDWSEPDLSFRLRQRYGDHSLYFSPHVSLEHHPSRGGAYLFRTQDSRQRLENYHRFARRWVAPTARNRLYKYFLYGYYTWKQCSNR